MNLRESPGSRLEQLYFDTVDEQKMRSKKAEMVLVYPDGHVRFPDAERRKHFDDPSTRERWITQLKAMQQSETSHTHPTGYLSSEIVDSLKKNRQWLGEQYDLDAVHFYTAVSPVRQLKLLIDAGAETDGLLKVFLRDKTTGKIREEEVRIDLTLNPTKRATGSDVVILVESHIDPESPKAIDAEAWDAFAYDVSSKIAEYLQGRLTHRNQAGVFTIAA